LGWEVSGAKCQLATPGESIDHALCTCYGPNAYSQYVGASLCCTHHADKGKKGNTEARKKCEKWKITAEKKKVKY